MAQESYRSSRHLLHLTDRQTPRPSHILLRRCLSFCEFCEDSHVAGRSSCKSIEGESKLAWSEIDHFYFGFMQSSRCIPPARISWCLFQYADDSIFEAFMLSLRHICDLSPRRWTLRAWCQEPPSPWSRRRHSQTPSWPPAATGH